MVPLRGEALANLRLTTARLSGRKASSLNIKRIKASTARINQSFIHSFLFGLRVLRQVRHEAFQSRRLVEYLPFSSRSRTVTTPSPPRTNDGVEGVTTQQAKEMDIVRLNTNPAVTPCSVLYWMLCRSSGKDHPSYQLSVRPFHHI